MIGHRRVWRRQITTGKLLWVFRRILRKDHLKTFSRPPPPQLSANLFVNFAIVTIDTRQNINSSGNVKSNLLIYKPLSVSRFFFFSSTHPEKCERKKDLSHEPHNQIAINLNNCVLRMSTRPQSYSDKRHSKCNESLSSMCRAIFNSPP